MKEPECIPEKCYRRTMKMNTLEKLLVNNPLRSGMVRTMFRALLRDAGDLHGKTVLEIGCGQGVGTEILLRETGAGRIIALDYDFAQVARAQRRHGRRGTNGPLLFQADGERLPFADAQFDAVAEFAIFHHIPDWQSALCEVARVLKPGGLFLYEEFLRDFVGHPLTRLFLVHPESGIFSAESFYEGLGDAGLAPRPGQRRIGQWWLSGTAERRQ